MARKSNFISNKNQRKIDHVKLLLSRGTPRSQVRQTALHHLKMKPEHIQVAFEGNIYD